MRRWALSISPPEPILPAACRSCCLPKNETNHERLFGVKRASPYVKDAFHAHRSTARPAKSIRPRQGPRRSRTTSYTCWPRGQVTLELRLFDQNAARRNLWQRVRRNFSIVRECRGGRVLLPSHPDRLARRAPESHAASLCRLALVQAVLLPLRGARMVGWRPARSCPLPPVGSKAAQPVEARLQLRRRVDARQAGVSPVRQFPGFRSLHE